MTWSGPTSAALCFRQRTAMKTPTATVRVKCVAMTTQSATGSIFKRSFGRYRYRIPRHQRFFIKKEIGASGAKIFNSSPKWKRRWKDSAERYVCWMKSTWHDAPKRMKIHFPGNHFKFTQLEDCKEQLQDCQQQLSASYRSRLASFYEMVRIPGIL